MRRYYRRKEAGLCPQCGKLPPAPGKAWCEHCRAVSNRRTKSYPRPMQKKWDKNYRLRLNEETMNAYGGKCACCGESHLAFLELDHINGGGIAHRKEIGGQGNVFYMKLRTLGFPKDNLQVLCANCHRAKTRDVPCPPWHSQKRGLSDLETRSQKDRRGVDLGPQPRGPAKEPLPEKACLQCDKQIVKDHPSGGRGAKFCGQECKFAYQRIHGTKPRRETAVANCKQCGQSFEYYPKNHSGQYCSTACWRASRKRDS